MDEQVAIYTSDGAPCGSAPRPVMRARGLWHAATFVLLRSTDGGHVYVHRRTTTKDVFPGHLDCWAGGVVASGESVVDAAHRELREELGIRDAVLAPLHSFRFEPTHCHCHCFETRSDGPVVHQPEEVAEGAWRTVDELRALLDDPAVPFVPDGRAAIERWFAAGRDGQPRSPGG